MEPITTLTPRYTATEIHDRAGELPGFASPGNIHDICIDMAAGRHSLWQPVLSAAFLARLEGELHIPTGVRAAKGNATHINVASTPTMRIPPEDAILATTSIPFNLQGVIHPSRPFVSASLEPSVAKIPNSEDVLAAKIDKLLALKLGSGSVLEAYPRETAGRSSLARCVAGFSYLEDDEEGKALYEPLIMLGAIVGLNRELAEQIPTTTSSYEKLGWTPIANYMHGVINKIVPEVIPAAKPEDELEVCVRGLCNATSSNILADINEIQRHLTEGGLLQPF